MIIGVVGSRRRNSEEDFKKLEKYISKLKIDSSMKPKIYHSKMLTIVTGDCNKGGDYFARYIAKAYGYKLDEKKIRDPETGEEMDFNNHRWFDYYTMVKIFYKRDEEIAKEPLDYLIALVAPDRKGGTEKTIEYFKRYHKDWKEKLILI